MSEVSLMIKKQEKKMTEVLVKKTHFTFLEIERLFQLYREHAEDLDSMDRNTFREFLHDVFNMTDDILMDRIFKYFDSVNDGNITREEWIMGLNVFLKGIIEAINPSLFSRSKSVAQVRWMNKFNTAFQFTT